MILDYNIHRYSFNGKILAEIWDVQTKETYTVIEGTDYNEIEAECEALCAEKDN